VGELLPQVLAGRLAQYEDLRKREKLVVPHVQQMQRRSDGRLGLWKQSAAVSWLD
jgi:hypothetical protein